MNIQALESTAKAMVAKGKGLLAADESSPTIEKRFNSINVESTEKTRRSYRDLLFTAPGIDEYISGVILFDETIRQHSLEGKPFPELLSDRGIIPGIKVDLGLVNIPGTMEEKATRGLDGLEMRLEEYRQLGARFAKWRAVLSIADHKPTPLCLRINAHTLARYAAICQHHELVPIVEPEVLINGGHDLGRCERVMEKTLHQVFSELIGHGVLLEGMILKPSMVTSGLDNPDQADIDSVAKATIRCFKRNCSSSGTWYCFSIRRTEPGIGHCPPERHESSWHLSMGTEFFLRPGASGKNTAHLAGQRHKPGARPENTPAQSQM